MRETPLKGKLENSEHSQDLNLRVLTTKQPPNRQQPHQFKRICELMALKLDNKVDFYTCKQVIELKQKYKG